MAQKLDDATIDAWVATHAGWERVHQKSLAKEYKFADFGSALGFVVRLGCAAEKKDHHPDVELGWGRAKITWSTHDAGGITQLDLDMADATERLAK
jgi:4a-hydroxytetrahydrobiopterin dehydratase